MQLEILPKDQILARYGNGLAAVGAGTAEKIMAVSLNKAGRDTRPGIHQALKQQTGLKIGAITRALKEVKASPRTLTWKLIARGGPVPLKYFSPKEVRGGIKHTSPMDPNPYNGAFVRVGGWVSNEGKRGRVFRMGARKKTGRFGGHVMINVAGGKWGGRVEKVMSKVSIPNAMIEGKSRAAFETMGPRVVEEVGRVLTGVINGSINLPSRAKAP